MRKDDRPPHQARPCTISPGFIRGALGSALIATGETRVICTASVESRPPPWLHDGGWVTAEYAMLPGATQPRGRRDPGGRGKEIQRLIGRSLRACVDLKALTGPQGPVSIVCDCDVIEADGGTRTAAITGAYVALHQACAKLRAAGRLTTDPLRSAIAAVSVGLVPDPAGTAAALVDLCYVEDSAAAVDLNVVMLETGGVVEIQGTAERSTFSRQELNRMLDLAEPAISGLFTVQAKAIALP